jgi:competence protein ComEA
MNRTMEDPKRRIGFALSLVRFLATRLQAWRPVLAKVVGYSAGFVGLVLVGSGTFAKWLPNHPSETQLEVGGALGSRHITGAKGSTTPNGAEAAGSGEHPSDALITPDVPNDAGTDRPVGDAADAGAITADGKVVLNLASEADLRRLPGIGATRARAILTLRARLGRFRRVEDLLRVRGLGRRAIARLRPLVMIDVPP